VVCLGFVFLNVYQSKVKKEPKPEEPILQTAPTPASMTAAPESKSMEAKDAVIAETSAKSGNASPIDCKWANTSVSISGHQPSKSGDYVHAVANSDGVICIKDSSGKLHIGGPRAAVLLIDLLTGFEALNFTNKSSLFLFM
jgi:hypothetical protein